MTLIGRVGGLRTSSQPKRWKTRQQDMLVRSAVERQFIIIGEALQQVLRDDGTVAHSIADARRIVNFRNILVHGYSKVEWELVWDVIQNQLPVLQSQVADVLRQYGSADQ